MYTPSANESIQLEESDISKERIKGRDCCDPIFSRNKSQFTVGVEWNRSRLVSCYASGIVSQESCGRTTQNPLVSSSSPYKNISGNRPRYKKKQKNKKQKGGKTRELHLSLLYRGIQLCRTAIRNCEGTERKRGQRDK